MAQNDTIHELLEDLERSYKNRLLEGLLEADEYFENTNLLEAYKDFKFKTKYLLSKLKSAADRTEMFEVSDTISELLDSAR